MSGARRGFTLTEVLAAVAVLAVLMSAMAGFVWDLRGQRAVLADLSSDLSAGDALMMTLDRALLAVVASEPGVGAGVRGDGGSISLLTRGVAVGHQGEDPTGGALQRVTARWAEREGLTIARGPVARSEDEPGGPDEEVLSRRVERLTLRYHDGERWSGSFDSAERGGLPAAVEVALWFAPPGGSAIARESRAEPPQLDASESGSPPVLAAPDRLRVFAVIGGGL